MDDGPSEAPMVTVVFVDTVWAWMVKAPEVFPCRIVTEAGTVAEELVLESVTTIPPAGAAAPIVTVPEAVAPPVTEVGLRATETIAGGLTVSDALIPVPFTAAEICAVVGVPTVLVLTVKPACAAPAGTVTVAGTVAALTLDDRLTVNPPAGAGPVRVTVPVDAAGPTTAVGFNVIVSSEGGAIVRVADSVTDPTDPEITAWVCAATLTVLTVNIADDLPAAIETLAGTDADLVLDASLTVTPPVPAALVKTAVPVDEVPPAIVVGFSEIPNNVAVLIVNEADLVIEPKVAEIVAVAGLATDDVWIVKVADDAPAGTSIEAGTLQLVLLPDKTTVMPPGPVIPFNVTVPSADSPAGTAVGEIVIPTSEAGFIVSVPVTETEPTEAVTVAFV